MPLLGILAFMGSLLSSFSGRRTLMLLLPLTIVFMGFAYQDSLPGACNHQYAFERPPQVVNESLARQNHAVCFSAFSVMHSGVTKTPLWSAQHLTREQLQLARSLPRVNSFHEEDRLSPGEGATLKDYAKSGYDRGHMSPNGDMPDKKAQIQSFSLANMIPQNPDNNRYLWEGIESAVRAKAVQAGELYVVTGPMFVGNNLKRLNGRVLVPTHIFKAVYDPKSKQAAAYLVANAPGRTFDVITIADLEKRAGIDVFPGLSPAIKAQVANLPTPTPHGYGSK